MKVVLKDDMASLGKFGDVIKVANGYARNYLIPRGLAVEATSGNLKAAEQQKEAWVKRAKRDKDEADEVRGKMERLSLSFIRKTGEDDKLFGSVTSIDISAALDEQGFRVERKNIITGEPIKRLGDFKVRVKLHPEVVASLSISVVKE